MRDYLTSITPDGLSGVLFALEGIRGVVTLLNGPTGCKFFHSTTSGARMLRGADRGWIDQQATMYFGQPRVPCTYLDNADYVYGSAEKLGEALAALRDAKDVSLVCVVDSPGAALIGDDLRGIVSQAMGDATVVTVETPGFSTDVCHGYEAAGLAALAALVPAGTAARPVAPMPHPGRRPVVNLLGLCLYQRNWEGDAAELTRLLGLMGIDVGCVPFAGASPVEVARIGDADLNLVVRPEYGLAQARWLSERCGTPYLDCGGAPIGFAATERLARELAGRLGVDASPAIRDSERARARCYAHLNHLNQMRGLPRGATFSLEADWSEALSYLRFLVDYMGMAPLAVSVTNPTSDVCAEHVRAWMARRGIQAALGRDIEREPADIVLGSGETMARRQAAGGRFVGIECSLPSVGFVDVVPKTHLGVSGGMQLVEQLINAMP